MARYEHMHDVLARDNPPGMMLRDHYDAIRAMARSVYGRTQMRTWINLTNGDVCFGVMVGFRIHVAFAATAYFDGNVAAPNKFDGSGPMGITADGIVSILNYGKAPERDKERWIAERESAAKAAEAEAAEKAMEPVWKEAAQNVENDLKHRVVTSGGAKCR